MRLRIMPMLLAVVFILAACGETPGDEEIDFDGTQRPAVPAEATNADATSAPDAETDETQASSDEYENVTLSLGEVNVLPNSEVSAGGELEINLAFENNSDRPVELPLVRESYQLLDDSGLTSTPSTLDDTLINPEIPSGESVSGVLRYAVEDAMTTFTLNVGSFEPLLVDGNLDPETRP